MCAWPHSPQQPYHCMRSAPHSSSQRWEYGSESGAPPTATAAAGRADPPLPSQRLPLASLPAAADVEPRRSQLRLPPESGAGGCSTPPPAPPEAAPAAFAAGRPASPSCSPFAAPDGIGALPLPSVASARRMYAPTNERAPKKARRRRTSCLACHTASLSITLAADRRRGRGTAVLTPL